MNAIKLAPYYISWHYTRGIIDFFGLYKNFVWFFFNFFSVWVLFKTLFSPFQRLSERYRGGLDLENLLEVIVVNTVMRVVGFILRTVVIVIGLVVTVFVILLGLVVFVLWLVLPLLVLFLLIVGLMALFNFGDSSSLI